MNDFTRLVNGIVREGRRQERYEQREDRNSLTNDLLLAETREQRSDRSNVLDAPEMRNILASGRDLNNPLRVIPGDQPGTYRFTSGQLVTGDMRLSPEAIQEAQQTLGNRWQAPRVEPVAAANGIETQFRDQLTAINSLAMNMAELRDAPAADKARIADGLYTEIQGIVGSGNGSVTLAGTMDIDIDGRRVHLAAGQYSANSLGSEIAAQLGLTAADLEATRAAADRARAAAVQPAAASPAPGAAPDAPSPTTATPSPVQPAAAPVAGFEAPQGVAARAYNNVTVPTGLHQNQVDNVQQLLIDAGLDVGGQGGVPDNKWGRKSQAAFEQVCREAQPAIDPATVDFANPQDPQTQQFMQTAQARAAQRTGARGPQAEPAPITARTNDEPTLPPTDLVYRGEQVNVIDGVYRGEPVRAMPLGSDLPPGMTPEPASPTLEEARTRVMGELQGNIGRQEATIVESMIAAASPEGPRLTDRNGEVNSSELGAFQGVVSSITTIEGLDQLREQMRAAGVRDGQPVAIGESPQGNRIQADPNRIASIGEGVTIA